MSSFEDDRLWVGYIPHGTTSIALEAAMADLGVRGVVGTRVFHRGTVHDPRDSSAVVYFHDAAQARFLLKNKNKNKNHAAQAQQAIGLLSGQRPWGGPVGLAVRFAKKVGHFQRTADKPLAHPPLAAAPAAQW